MSEHASVERVRDRRRRSVPLTAVVLVLAAIGLLSIGLPGVNLPSLSNPFSTTTVERGAPVLLTKLTNLARFQAATGSFEKIIDDENDVNRLPSQVAGERTLFVAVGSVDAYVDFAGLDRDAVTVSNDGKRVDIVLPPAALSKARVDPELSYLVSRERGVLNRLGGIFSDNPTSERDLYRKAEREFGEAAKVGGLQERAEENTRLMLTGLLGTLGYSDVHVQFSPDVRP